MNYLTVTRNDISTYMVNIGNIPMLSAEEEMDLALRIYHDNDSEAAKKMILSHLRFVVYLAKKYVHYGLPLEDLIQEGNIGLMKAVQKFDPTKGVKLISYASYYIKAAIHEYVMRTWKFGKLVTTKPQRKLFYNLRQMKADIGHSSEAERKSIAKALDVPLKDVREMEERLYTTQIAFDGTGEDIYGGDDYSIPPAEYLHAEGTNPEHIIEDDEYQSFVKSKIMGVIDNLSDRDRDIILSRKFRDIPLTLQELSDRYGVSLERIRQLEENVIKKLKIVVEEI